MPHCKQCLTEYEEGFTVCNDCGNPLEPGPLLLPVEPPPTTTEWVMLRECANDLEAELLKQLLESQGIAVLRKGAFRGSYSVAGSSTGFPGERITLLVPDDQLGNATRMIQERLLAGRKTGNLNRQLIAERAKIIRRRRKRRL